MVQKHGQDLAKANDGDQGETVGNLEVSGKDKLRPLLPLNWFRFPETRGKEALPGDKLFQPPSIRKKWEIYISNALLDGIQTIRKLVEEETSKRTGFNLIPVLVGLGAVLYFTAPAEPSLLALVSVLLILTGVWLKLGSRGLSYVSLSVLVFLLAGFTLAKLQTILVAAPTIDRQTTTKLRGVVVNVSRNTRGSPRYTIRPGWAEDISTEKLPSRVRLSAASRHQLIKPGDEIEGLVRLFPFTGPAYPDGYSFYFHSWFDGIGGTGFFMGPPQKLGSAESIPLDEWVANLINGWRSRVANRLRAALPDETGDIAVALITGERAGLDKDTQESLRKSGLAHILAISGMHMALVTLTVVGVIRSAGAIWPSLVLRYPLHKLAALFGFSAATIYLILSGAGTATQRAWIMISVMLLATMMDRKAVTMRSVAIGAMIILAISPQSILSPGFQMSFAAVSALVAVYDTWRNYRANRRERTFFAPVRSHQAIGVLLGKYVAGILVTSLVAGTATALFSAYHFHRVAPFGLVANLLAMPLVSLAVIPLGLASMVLMPFGYEHLALTPFSSAINGVLEISKRVNEHSPDGITGFLSGQFLASGSLALVILCVLRTRLRWIGLVFVGLAVLVYQKPKPPDILVAETGRAIAVKNGDGNLELLYPRKNRFVTEIWQKAWPQQNAGVAPDQPEIKPTYARHCHKDGCSLKLPNGDQLEIVYDPKRIQQACRKADILIAPRLWWVRCKSKKPNLILKRPDFEQYGSHAIYISSSQMQKTGIDEGLDSRTAYRVERAMPSTARLWDRSVPPK